MKNIKFIAQIEEIEKKFYENLEILFIVLSFLCFVAWIMFIFCCFLALGSDGPYGSIIETGVYMIKHHPIITIISLIPAVYFIRVLDKIK